MFRICRLLVAGLGILVLSSVVCFTIMTAYLHTPIYKIDTVQRVVIHALNFYDNGGTLQPMRDHANHTQGNKMILLWTEFCGQRNYFSDKDFRNCAESRCMVTSDRSLRNVSAAVIFHYNDIKDRPSERFRQQRFILFNLESPPHVGDTTGRISFNHFFNWTMTYRRDSDIFAPYAYSAQRPQPLEVNIKNLLSSKTALVAIMYSNCVPRERINYVSELKEYIQVDDFGKCGTLNCDENSCEDVIKKYKFYLAFENTRCRDYITEKFWHALQTRDAVPIAMGGGSVDEYTRVAPLHSFIHVDHFTSPKELAEYLLILNKNDGLYLEYHSWRSTYVINNNVGTNFVPVCELCKRLHDVPIQDRVLRDVEGWFANDVDTCHLEL